MFIRSLLLKKTVVLALSGIACLSSAARADDCSNALAAESCACQGVPTSSPPEATKAKTRSKKAAVRAPNASRSETKSRALEVKPSRASL